MKCICDWGKLLRDGCYCGAFASEMKEKYEKETKIIPKDYEYTLQLCSCEGCKDKYKPFSVEGAQIFGYDCAGNRIERSYKVCKITNSENKVEIEIKDRKPITGVNY